jgi:hypothetical protein
MIGRRADASLAREMRLRVGTDIVGGDLAPTFNPAFSSGGSIVPEPSTWAMMLLGFAGYRQTGKASAASA